jgi:hypothetical protein
MRVISTTDVENQTGSLVTTISSGLGDSAIINSSEIQCPSCTIWSVGWYVASSPSLWCRRKRTTQLIHPNLPIPISQTLTRLVQTSFLSALTSNNLTAGLDSTPGITISIQIESAILPGGKPCSNGHVLEEVTAYTPDIVLGQEYKTNAGTTIAFPVKDGKYYVNDALIEQANVITKNDAVHFLDRLAMTAVGEKDPMRCGA